MTGQAREPALGTADWAPSPALGAYLAGVAVICELAAQFTAEGWNAPTPCPEWRAADLAAHLRCVADDYHEYLDEAPRSRLARLMSHSTDPGSLARKLARQNAAELAALPDGAGPEHIACFAASARAYADRVVPAWDLPHHRYQDTVVTTGGMVGAACAEWHLHAWDLAQALGKDYQPADPGILVAGWQAGVPQLPLDMPVAVASCCAAPAVLSQAGGMGGGSPGWETLLRASGRISSSGAHAAPCPPGRRP